MCASCIQTSVCTWEEGGSVAGQLRVWSAAAAFCPTAADSWCHSLREPLGLEKHALRLHCRQALPPIIGNTVALHQRPLRRSAFWTQKPSSNADDRCVCVCVCVCVCAFLCRMGVAQLRAHSLVVCRLSGAVQFNVLGLDALQLDCSGLGPYLAACFPLWLRAVGPRTADGRGQAAAPAVCVCACASCPVCPSTW